MTTEYADPAKVITRQNAIRGAISALTKNRSDATLCRRTYVREVRDTLVAGGDCDAMAAAKLTDETIDRWEAFYDSVTHSRDPQNLKVAYLCGPNPENDLHVFCAAGILPENIWAFESDAHVHDKAVA